MNEENPLRNSPLLAQAPIIVLEGIDGTGKTTQMNLLKTYFESQQVSCFQTGPYIASDTCRAIKSIVTGAGNVSPLTQAALIVAGQLECGQAIETWSNTTPGPVLMDRGWLSTLVYQGLAENMLQVVDLLLYSMVTYSNIFKSPDLVFYLTTSPTRANARVAEARQTERFKARGVSWAQTLHQNYETTIRDLTQQVTELDASPLSRQLDSLRDWERLAVRKLLLGTECIILDSTPPAEEVHAQIVNKIQECYAS